ncbi:hypothetical protein ANCCEY_00153 [Ancylostoma ceylanicum]|uniref:Domain of unknown function DB domain-containing protein n=1 Tax=Ancylostoma ceylanicum TaxID=53326 RepID=A0A0D6MDJ0_9BILA|nr:hypothetical protein ANCCEY_00153 [Ancylostoma ceylanicum]
MIRIDLERMAMICRELKIDHVFQNFQLSALMFIAEIRLARTLHAPRNGVMMPKSFISEEASVDPHRTRGESVGWRQKRFCSFMSNPRRCKKLMDSYTSRTAIVKRNFITTSVLLEPPHERSYRRRSARPPTQGWSVKIIPVQKVKSWPEGVDALPKFAVDGSAVRREETSDKARGHNSASMGIRPSVPVISPEPSFTLANRPPPVPQPPVPRLPLGASQQCGVAPNFRPCVTSQQASHALLECCRRKNLPPGCLSLCRYDITQAEHRVTMLIKPHNLVRSAMDRGLCGIFSVAPYLECASQGKDNTECCRHKGVVAKT